MELHHSKHHNAYVTNLNNLLATQAEASSANDIRKQLSLQQGIKFNAGGHINHSLFWENLAPANAGLSDPEKVAPKLSAALREAFGGSGIDQLKPRFETLLLSIQGSGWGWLVLDPQSRALSLVQTKDQDPVADGKIPIVGVDMWEHAYYLQYLNGKAAYVKAIWTVISWETAEKRYTDGAWWTTWSPLLNKL